ncbi:hypothetical protein FHS21_005964 [Phyllobacterium trifolii]|jgi:hypothetical protein|uniref:AprE-like beta-barrel domain-containing protein n=1 Tax=Phyllobacterium trifolii TaxID=300193 RepID=A0A839UKV9_9HYPH|nr:hypothetical protein [Phyllobacterium trifolii]MBB3149510.1 hypothetical protein [Phyllobacterium trifolii]
MGADQLLMSLPRRAAIPLQGQVYYLSDVIVPSEELEKLGEAKLLPGMPVEVFISTEERTAMSFLSRPVQPRVPRAMNLKAPINTRLRGGVFIARTCRDGRA